MEFHLADLFIDNELQIPVRYVSYGWPARAGEEPPINEEYNYIDTQLNVGLTGADFSEDLLEPMAEVLQRDFGVTAAWEEGRSLTTFENAKFSAQILAASGIRRVYLVTHAAHVPRSVEIFERWGLHVIPVPTGFTMPVGSPSTFSLVPRAYYLGESGRALRELLGMEFYQYMYD